MGMFKQTMLHKRMNVKSDGHLVRYGEQHMLWPALEFYVAPGVVGSGLFVSAKRRMRTMMGENWLVATRHIVDEFTLDIQMFILRWRQRRINSYIDGENISFLEKNDGEEIDDGAKAYYVNLLDRNRVRGHGNSLLVFAVVTPAEK